VVDIAILDHLSVIALLMVVLIGLPHGALDGAIAMHLGAGRNISFVFQFLFLYLLCGFIVVVLWYNFVDYFTKTEKYYSGNGLKIINFIQT